MQTLRFSVTLGHAVHLVKFIGSSLKLSWAERDSPFFCFDVFLQRGARAECFEMFVMAYVVYILLYFPCEYFCFPRLIKKKSFC